jgi:hypothetical protein
VNAANVTGEAALRKVNAYFLVRFQIILYISGPLRWIQSRKQALAPESPQAN